MIPEPTMPTRLTAMIPYSASSAEVEAGEVTDG